MTFLKRFLKVSLKPSIIGVLSGSLFICTSVAAQTVVEQWKQGLKGASLTAYSGSVTSSNSTLTVINFCHNGRYSYYKEGSWSVSGLDE